MPNQVVIFAGDLGGTSKVTPYMYYKNDNITLIGSGMGSGIEDNVILVEVNENGFINYKLIGLNNKSLSEIGRLEDYVLP